MGIVSEEESVIEIAHKDGTVTLENEYRFDTKTGKCLNDNTFDGAKRTLKLDD
jgi:hypothetical protein